MPGLLHDHARWLRHPASAPDLDRRLPGVRDAPDDGRGPALLRGGGRAAAERLLAPALPPPGARRVGGLLAPRPHPALLLVPGGGGPALLHREPDRRRPISGPPDTPFHLAGRPADHPRDLPALARPSADLLHVRGHPHPDRAGLRVPVPARLSPRARPVAGRDR